MTDDAKRAAPRPRKPPNEFTITYERLGTIHPQEQIQAIVEDINTLLDLCGPYYLTGVLLTLHTTNEWGDPVVLRKSSGERVKPLTDTNHYRPACRDYEL